jgi:hypothetical protein
MRDHRHSVTRHPDVQLQSVASLKRELIGLLLLLLPPPPLLLMMMTIQTHLLEGGLERGQRILCCPRRCTAVRERFAGWGAAVGGCDGGQEGKTGEEGRGHKPAVAADAGLEQSRRDRKWHEGRGNKPAAAAEAGVEQSRRD